MTRDPRGIKEHQLQKTVMTAVRLKCRKGVVAFSIPNELPASERSRFHFAAMGMKPGVADILVIIDGVAHFLELKTLKGRQSREQKTFQLECELNGIPYALARSFDEATAALDAWGAFVRRDALRRAA